MSAPRRQSADILAVMGRTVQPEEPIGILEIRAGLRHGAPHEGGRRGSLAYDGPFPLVAKSWLRGLQAHPLAERFGGLWIYLDGELVSAQPSGAPPPDDPSEVRARQINIDMDAMEADVRQGKQVHERLEVKVVALAERVAVEQRRVDMLRAEGVELEARIKAERQRVENELALLDQNLAQARQVATAVKTQLQKEQLEFAETMAKQQEMIDAAFRAQLQRTTQDAAVFERYEKAIAEASQGRKAAAVAQTTAVVELMEKVEEGALHKLMPQGPKEPGPGSKFLDWLMQGGGIGQIGDAIGKVASTVKGPPRPPGS